MARVFTQFRQLLAVVLLLALAGACNNNNSGDAAEKDAKGAANATTEEPAATAAPVEVIADDLYPDFRMDQFNAEQRTKIVKLTKAELCPCADASASMHECMQDREKRCELAEQAMNMIGGMVNASYTETDILDQLSKFLEAATKVHQFKIADHPVKGSATASVMIVEFADFECPHCKEAAKLMRGLNEKYGDKIGIVFKNYPLPAHQFAELAARASIAAHRQGKFWPMHDELFKNQTSLSYEKIVSIAQRIGLNIGKFKVDVESPDVREMVAADRKEGEDAGITGTPTMFINGKRFLGDGGGEEALHAAIDKALSDAAKDKTTTTKTN